MLFYVKNLTFPMHNLQQGVPGREWWEPKRLRAGKSQLTFNLRPNLRNENIGLSVSLHFEPSLESF